MCVARQLANVLDLFPALECIAWRGNPAIANKLVRSDILSGVRKLGSTSCPLRIVDTEISLDERVRLVRGTVKNARLLRFELAIGVRCTLGANEMVQHVVELDLTGMRLELADFRSWTALETLLLAHNMFESTGTHARTHSCVTHACAQAIMPRLRAPGAATCSRSARAQQTSSV